MSTQLLLLVVVLGSVAVFAQQNAYPPQNYQAYQQQPPQQPPQQFQRGGDWYLPTPPPPPIPPRFQAPSVGQNYPPHSYPTPPAFDSFNMNPQAARGYAPPPMHMPPPVQYTQPQYNTGHKMVTPEYIDDDADLEAEVEDEEPVISGQGFSTQADQSEKAWEEYQNRQRRNLDNYYKRRRSLIAKKGVSRRFVFRGRWLPRQLVVVKKAYEDLGWSEVQWNDPLGFDSIWGTGGCLKPIELAQLTAHQRYNHYPCTSELGSKDKVSLNLEQVRLMDEKFDEEYDFFPKSYLMPQHLPALEAEIRRHPEKLWILKPKAAARGEGIRMLNGIDDLPKDKINKFLVQEYINNPLLLTGVKHTLRVYVAVTSLNPLRIYMMDEGFVHMATSPYTTEPDKITDITVHITNPDVQGDNFQNAGGAGMYWNHTTFRDYVKVKYPQLDNKAIFKDVERLVVKTILAAQDVLFFCTNSYIRQQRSAFEVWGFDVMIDDKGKAWFIEVNHTPSTNTDFDAAKLIKYWMVRDLIRLVHPTAAEIERAKATVSAQLIKLGWWDPNDASSLVKAGLNGPLIDTLIDTEAEFQVTDELKDEFGHWRRVFPSKLSFEEPYPKLHEDTAEQIVLNKWVKSFITNTPAVPAPSD